MKLLIDYNEAVFIKETAKALFIQIPKDDTKAFWIPKSLCKEVFIENSININEYLKKNPQAKKYLIQKQKKGEKDHIKKLVEKLNKIYGYSGQVERKLSLWIPDNFEIRILEYKFGEWELYMECSGDEFREGFF